MAIEADAVLNCPEGNGKTRKPQTIVSVFGQIAQIASQKLGHPASFVVAVSLVIIWGASGPIFKYSDTWQLVINTSTTIVTFLMVFLIQNTQNRDSAVLHLKLDELIRVSESARNKLLDLEGLTEEELKRLKGSFTKLADSPDTALLQEAVGELDAAGEGIRGAKEKVTAAAGKNP